MEIRASVRNFVEFLLREGDIDNRRGKAPEDAMTEGGRIHRMIQRGMGSTYHAEQFLRYVYQGQNYNIIIEGRADGIITSEDGSYHTIDEIKGTYRDLHKMKTAVSVHLAQAKCYAYMYAAKQQQPGMKVRMTYCNMDTEEIRYFYQEYTFIELTEWFEKLLCQYTKWADYEYEWKEKRQASIEQLTFPFPYREGQKELASYVYQTIYHKRKLFVEAPTGAGKTISTVFPAVKAMGKGMGDKLFYLTAKTITGTVAEDTFALLRQRGLCFKSVMLTAKEKICFMEETECNPEYCPYAKGHYNRINDAIYDMLVQEDSFRREDIAFYAQKHKVCPFEMALDLSLFSDGIVCDYNYVFDPHVYLRRFFADGMQGNYIFLVDEAHNLLDRGREMYSALLRKEDFLALKKVVKAYDTKMEKQLESCNRELLILKRECENCEVVHYIDGFVRTLTHVSGTMEKYLEDHDDSPVRKEILEFYFEISHFLEIYERVDDNYVMYTEMEADGSFILKLFCVNPSVNLRECMMKGRSTILFSATLLPIQYYKKLLGGVEEDYEVYAHSVFEPEKKGLFIGCDVTTRYARRTLQEYYNIASYIHKIVSRRQGNYMIFFPSYAFLREVYEAYAEYFQDEASEECICQESDMEEQDRETFLSRFAGNEDCDLNAVIHMDIETEEEKSLLGFCVMGGIFGEGIDLKKDSLIGAVIVGTGIPQVCNERELLKNYFDAMGEAGFDYAYRYPGMNKVLQAAGRVIRTAEDIGIVALLDERFLQTAYQKMFPREWEHFEVVTMEQIGNRIDWFWNGWL